MKDKLILPPRENYIETIEVLQTPLNDFTEKVCSFCQYCMKDSDKVHQIETLQDGFIGRFCSVLCSNSMAIQISNSVTLRERPTVYILPLCFYKNKEDILRLIAKYRNNDFIFHGHEKIKDGIIITKLKRFRF